jgi:beta-propeller repeat-containing protein
VSKPSAHRPLFSFIIALAAVAASALIIVGSARSRRQFKSAVATQAAPAQSLSAVTPAARARIQASYAALPLAFEANEGQTDPQVKYLARGNRYTLFLTPADAVFSFESVGKQRPLPGNDSRQISEAKNSRPHPAREDARSVIHMRLAGANPKPGIVHGETLAGVTNYFVGNDTKKWHSNVPQYSAISYDNIYPGVKMVFHGQQRQLEFDFVVAAGADPARIGLAFSGARRRSTDHQGNLILASSAGSLLLHKPVAYQAGQNGARRLVDAGFVLKAANEVGLKLGSYDRSRELVIDPSVTYAYATYLGGTAEDDAYAVAFDSSGSAYVTGQTKSSDFPTKSPLQGTNKGGFDAFVTKLSADGSSLLFSTYIGGSADDSGNAIALDASNNVYVAGGTKSSDFPHTAGAFQPVFGGGSVDAFALELSSTGSSLIYSTYLGGNGDDVANGLAIDTTGAYVVGQTGSSTFPTHLPLQAALVGTSNGFVTKFNTGGSALIYSTYLGGGTGDLASAVAVDSTGNAYVTGATQNPTFRTTLQAFQTKCGTDGTCNGGLDDAFVSVIKPDGSNFKYSTFLGGSNTDVGLSIAVDASLNAYVTGSTASTDFPLKSPLQGTYGGGISDAFVTVLNPAGRALVYSTYLGGSQNDIGTSIALDGSANAYITGQTGSSNFPMANAVQGTIGGLNDAFVSEINHSGSALLFSTFLGGSLNEDTSAANGGGAVGAIAVDTAGGNIYVVGTTLSTNFPTKSPFQAASRGLGDAFVAKYSQSVTTPDFSIAASALNPATVAQGGSATSTVTVTALNGYAKTVRLSCAVSGGGSPAPKCSLNPTSTSGSGSSTLTVTTTGASGALIHPSNIFYAMLLPVFGLSLVGIRFSYAGSRCMKLLGFLLLGIVMTALFFLPACGGSSSSSGGGCTGCTPKGTYTVTVTGTDGTLTHSVSPALTLTVN